MSLKACRLLFFPEQEQAPDCGLLEWNIQTGCGVGRQGRHWGCPGTLAQLAGQGTQRAIVEHVLREERPWPRRIWGGGFLFSWGHAPFDRNGDREMSGLKWLLQDILILKHSDTRGCSVSLKEKNSSDTREEFLGLWSLGHNFLHSIVLGLFLFPTNQGGYCHQMNCSPREIMKDRMTGGDSQEQLGASSLPHQTSDLSFAAGMGSLMGEEWTYSFTHVVPCGPWAVTPGPFLMKLTDQGPCFSTESWKCI